MTGPTLETDAFLAGVLFALVALALVRLVRRSSRDPDRLDTHGVRTVGEVLDVWQDGTGSFRVRYRFTPEGASRPVTRSEYAGCLRVAVPDVGDKVGVRYDPAAPEIARLEREGC